MGIHFQSIGMEQLLNTLNVALQCRKNQSPYIRETFEEDLPILKDSQLLRMFTKLLLTERWSATVSSDL